MSLLRIPYIRQEIFIIFRLHFQFGDAILRKRQLRGSLVQQSLCKRNVRVGMTMNTQHTWKKWIAGIVLLLAVVPLLCACTTKAGEGEVTVQELQKKMAGDKELVVLDVRTAPELTAELGKLDGVINVPLQELEQRLPEMKKFEKSPVYIIRRSEYRSGIATRILREKGYDAHNVTGGMRAWRAAFGTKNH